MEKLKLHVLLLVLQMPITFGDLNDMASQVLEKSKSNRAYRVIEEVGTQANVYYQVKVRNVENNIA